MSDDELTPAERDALRARITRGALTLRPVGAHRGAWIAVVVAVVLVAGITAGAIAVTRNPPVVAVTPSPTPTVAPTPAPSPTPAPTPTTTPTPVAQTVVPFGGDCARELDQASAAAAVGEGAVSSRPTTLASVTPDYSASAAQIGGLVCSWGVPGTYPSVLVSVFPVTVVPAELQAEQIGECDYYSGCTFSLVRDDMWIAVDVGPLRDDGQLSIDDARADLRTRATAMLEAVAAAPVEVLRGVAGPREPLWSDLNCSRFETSVVDATGMAAPQEGYPSDVFPSGPVWEVFVANGVAASCAWYDLDQSALTSAVIQPGLAVPDDDQLLAADAVEITVPGAARAWSVTPRGDFARIIVQTDAGRVTVTGTNAEAVAAAYLAALGS